MAKVIKFKNDQSISNSRMCIEERSGVYFERGRKNHEIAVALEAEASELEFDLIQKRMQMEKYYERAVVYFEKSANLGHYEACNELSRCYDSGVGTDEDLELSKFWSQKAKEIRSRSK